MSDRGFFFFDGTTHGEDLPSSPTGRSPDLSQRRRASGGPPMARASAGVPPVSSPAGAACRYSPQAICSAVSARNASRSEEHTSELQSRQYLVCRLLLEKKKLLTPVLRPSLF